MVQIQKRKLGDESDSGEEGKLNYENDNGHGAQSKRRRYSAPNESCSTWFKAVSPAEGDGETESSSEGSDESSSESGTSETSLAIPEPPERDGELIGRLIDYTEGCGVGDKGPRNIDPNESLHSPPSKEHRQIDLQTDDSGSETESSEDSEQICNYSDPFAEPVRKIYLSPDRYAEYIAKVKKEEQLKKYKEDAKKRKPWELRSMSERGPRAGRSDEFLTEEEAQYAENILRAAARHRLETWHRERHEMWGLKGIRDPDAACGEAEREEEEEEGDSKEEEDMQTKKEPGCGSGGSKPETLLSAASISQADITDDATIEEVLQGVPGPLDPCFRRPADIVFLPRTPKFTEAVFKLEFQMGYTRKQVRWLMGGDRSGRGVVPSINTIAMRLKRYMEKTCLMNTVKKRKTRCSMGKSNANCDDDDEDDEEGSSDREEDLRPLLPHGPRTPRPQLGVHGWVWDHPHEVQQTFDDNYY